MGAVVLGIFLVIASFLIVGATKQAGDKFDGRPAAFATRGIGIVLLIGGILWSGVVQVPAGSQGVLLRFGALQGSLNPGIHLIIPGVNDVILMETRTQKEESQATAAS